MEYPITANRIKKAMEAKGIKAVQLSELSGVDKSSISHYVNGSNKPLSLKAEAMARVLNVNPLWLMGFDVPEDRTLFLYSKLSEADKARVQGYIEHILEEDVYKKDVEGGEVV